jgi:aspartate aminotransferase-like enzyme
MAASKTNTLPRSYWDWQEMVKINASGFFPYTPATNLLYGLKEALAMLQEEGLDNVFARHSAWPPRPRRRQGLGAGSALREPGRAVAGADRRDDAAEP